MSPLPSPPHWTNVQGRAFTSYLLFTAMLVAVSSLNVLVKRGGVGLAEIVIPLWSAAVLAAGLYLRSRSQQRATCNQYGTTLYPDRSGSTVILFGTMSLFALGLLYALLVWAGVDMPALVQSRRYPSSSPAADGFGATFAAVIGIVMIPALLWSWRRGAGNFLNLNPEGFHANEKPVKAARWDDVIDVLDFIPWADPSVDKLWPPPMAPIVFVMRDRSMTVVSSGNVYAPNGSAVFWMVRNYWRHPEQRGELLNGVALDRLAAEQFPAD